MLAEDKFASRLQNPGHPSQSRLGLWNCAQRIRDENRVDTVILKGDSSHPEAL